MKALSEFPGPDESVPDESVPAEIVHEKIGRAHV